MTDVCDRQTIEIQLGCIRPINQMIVMIVVGTSELPATKV